MHQGVAVRAEGDEVGGLRASTARTEVDVMHHQSAPRVAVPAGVTVAGEHTLSERRRRRAVDTLAGVMALAGRIGGRAVRIGACTVAEQACGVVAQGHPTLGRLEREERVVAVRLLRFACSDVVLRRRAVVHDDPVQRAVDALPSRDRSVVVRGEDQVGEEAHQRRDVDGRAAFGRELLARELELAVGDGVHACVHVEPDLGQALAVAGASRRAAGFGQAHLQLQRPATEALRALDPRGFMRRRGHTREEDQLRPREPSVEEGLVGGGKLEEGTPHGNQLARAAFREFEPCLRVVRRSWMADLLVQAPTVHVGEVEREDTEADGAEVHGPFQERGDLRQGPAGLEFDHGGQVVGCVRCVRRHTDSPRCCRPRGHTKFDVSARLLHVGATAGPSPCRTADVRRCLSAIRRRTSAARCPPSAGGRSPSWHWRSLSATRAGYNRLP